MAYVSDSNLTQFWGLAKDYFNAEVGRFANWQKTEKAGVVTCWPVGGTELLPTVDFLFAETGPASGDKGPENPSTIAGVSSVKVTRRGKNLCPLVNAAVPNISTAGVTILVDAVSGSFSISGKATANSTISFTPALTTNFLAYGTLRVGKTYTFSLRGNTPSTGLKLRLFVTTTSSPSWSSDKINVTTNNSSIYMLPDDIVKAWLRIDISQDTDFGTGCIFTVQVEEGETATEFEPYFENKYTLPLNDTYYGGSIDLATGLMTVTHSSEQLTSIRSVQSVNTNTVCFRLTTTAIFVPENPTIHLTTTSNKFIYLSGSGDFEYFRVAGAYGASSNIVEISINKTRLDVSSAVDPSSPTDAEWKAALALWLESNPTVFVGKLFTPYTVQLTPLQLTALTQTDKYTPRLNTIYTDASAVQVGYAKSPIRSEYELTQAIIATEGGE